MEIERAGGPPTQGDTFQYSAKPIMLADRKSVPEL
jgi:hypothetical protein